MLFNTALSVTLHAQRFEAKLVNQDENFAGLNVNAIVQDKSGHVWVATPSGVLIYDGSRFHAFGRDDGLADPDVFSLLVDNSGTVWAGGHGGLFWFDGQRFHELLFHGKSLHIGVNSMLAVSQSDEIVAQTPHELYSITRPSPAGDLNLETYWNRHPAYKSDRDWNGLGFDANGNLVMGCDETLCIFEDNRVRVLGVAQGVAPDYYVSIYRARNGVLWARGRKHILALRPGDRSAIEAGNLLPAGALTTTHRRFTEDMLGNILTPTALGFAIWDGKQWTETESTTQGTLGGASEVFGDREGSIWIGTDGAGLLESRGYRIWTNYGREQGFGSPNITSIAKDRSGTLWFGTTQQTMILKKGATTLVESPLKGKQDTEEVVSMAPTPDGGMWVGTQLGVVDHVSSSGRIDMKASIDAYIRRIRMAPDGTLWIATNEGLFRAHCSGGTPCVPKAFNGEGWTQSPIRDFALDPDGSLWIAGDHGLTQIREGKSRAFPVLSQYRTPITGRIDLLTRDGDGSLWLARNNLELLHVRLKGDHGESYERFAKPQLPSETFSFVEVGPGGSLWIGTDHGVARITQGTLRVTNYDDGLIWNSTGEGAFFADSDNTAWIGTALGVSHLLNEQGAFTRNAFPAEIGSIHYGDAGVQDGGRLKWTGGVANVEFTGLTFHGNQALIYRYRLQGFDDQVIVTHAPFVRFQKLPPGSYVFRVVAEDPIHNTFSTPAELSFTLLPPWWRTGWFKGVVTIAVILVLIALWYMSHLALLAQRRKLQRMVAERTSKLEYLVLRDGLTGLLNRNAILEKLSSEIDHTKLSGKSLCVSLIDLDHFKRINDNYGHLAGDTVLREAATRLHAAVRTTDFIGRYGGEEFIVVFTEIERELSMKRCELMRQALCLQPVIYDGSPLDVTCSIGLAGWAGQDDSLTDLVARADRAMYTAKNSGRNRVALAD